MEMEPISWEQDHAERRLRLEESFPKKWGAVLFGSLATIIVAIISATIAFMEVQQTERLSTLEAAQTERISAREDARARTERQIENARTALELYFTNYDRLAAGDNRAVNHLALLAEISEVPAVRDIFFEMRSNAIIRRREEDPSLSVAEAAEGLVSLSSERPADDRGITVFLHYPESVECAAIATLAGVALQEQGYRVPAFESLPAERSPDQSQVRFYSTLQQVRQRSLLDILQAATRVEFEDMVLMESLPEGVFEVWIGRTACGT